MEAPGLPVECRVHASAMSRKSGSAYLAKGQSVQIVGNKSHVRHINRGLPGSRIQPEHNPIREPRPKDSCLQGFWCTSLPCFKDDSIWNSECSWSPQPQRTYVEAAMHQDTGVSRAMQTLATVGWRCPIKVLVDVAWNWENNMRAGTGELFREDCVNCTPSFVHVQWISGRPVGTIWRTALQSSRQKQCKPILYKRSFGQVFGNGAVSGAL